MASPSLRAAFCCLGLAACASSPPPDPRAGQPPPSPVAEPPTPLSTMPTPPAPTAPSSGGTRRTGEGVDLVHVTCTLDIRRRPHRSRCEEAAPDAALPSGLAACTALRRRPATAARMAELTRAWEAAAPRVANGGGPLRPGAGVTTPQGIPRADSVDGRPAVMVVDMRLLGMRHAKHRAAGCDDVPANTGCDPIAVGHGALVPAEARGRVQMVSEGFGGVGRCDRP